MGLRQLMSGSLSRHKTKKSKKNHQTQESIAESKKLINKLNNIQSQHVPSTPMVPNYNDFNVTAAYDSPVNNQKIYNDYSAVNCFDGLQSVGHTKKNDNNFIVNFTSTDGSVYSNNSSFRYTDCSSDLSPSTPTTPDSYSLPRPRSRIKTNPWLASHMTSSQETPLNNRTFLVPLKSTNFVHERTNSRNSQTVLKKQHQRHIYTNDNFTKLQAESIADSANYSDSSDQRLNSSIDSQHNYDSVPYDSDHYSEIPDGDYFKRHDNLKKHGAVELPRSFGIANFKDLDELAYLDLYGKRRPTVTVDSNPPTPQISFEYEDELDSRLEDLPVKSIMDTSDPSLYSADGESDPLFCPNQSFYLKHLKKISADGNGNESTATDDTLCSEYKKSNRKHRHKNDLRIKQKGMTSVIPSGNGADEDNDADAEDNKDDGFSERASSLAEESFDSAIDSSMSTSDSPSAESPNDNSMVVCPAEEIKSSDMTNPQTLQQRVKQLRIEKEIVDGKIQQARDEEYYRQKERQRLQKEAALQRKSLLLQTLHDLKSKLEGQNQRLQTTYSTVLNMQKIITCQKRQQGGEHIAVTCTNEELLF